jgi:5-methyltetrahydropteroyltriglutamate--homocysteine methyltransferase
MKRSTHRILTTHAGRLTTYEITGPTAMGSGTSMDWESFSASIRPEMTQIIRKQINAGIDIISDGELGKVGFGFLYYGRRLNGISSRPLREGEVSGRFQYTNDRLEFADFYRTMTGAGSTGSNERMICAGPITYKGHDLIKHEIETFKAALQESGESPQEEFMCVLAPGWLEHFLFNEYYKTDEEFLFAVADAMKYEYKAIVDAGFLLQLDDPALATKYDMIVPNPSIEEYRKIAALRIDALNHALEGIPEDRVRYHVCWGSWHGPHAHDIPLKYIIDLVLKVKAQGYSVEAGNGRHEHEWKVWKDVKLPADKVLIPGVVSHVSNTIEHPELVADRLLQFASVVGKENVIAGTDCGMGGRIHMQLGWAKLKALADGAALASKELWP